MIVGFVLILNRIFTADCKKKRLKILILLVCDRMQYREWQFVSLTFYCFYYFNFQICCEVGPMTIMNHQNSKFKLDRLMIFICIRLIFRDFNMFC